MPGIYIKDIEKNKFVKLTAIKGDTGKSAYEIWLNQGNVGTEENFIADLKGKDSIYSKNETQNILNANKTEVEKNGIKVSIDQNNHLKISGTATAYVSINLLVSCVIEENENYTISTQNTKILDTTSANVTIKVLNGSEQQAITTISRVGNLMSKQFVGNKDITSLNIIIATNTIVNLETDIQIEKGSTYSEYKSPLTEDKIIMELSDGLVKENNLDENLKKKINSLYNMNYIYVNKTYTEDDEGFGVTKFNSILKANKSIIDNNQKNRYTIIVEDGEYDEFEEEYKNTIDITDLQGIVTKDYVYYESQSNTPEKCILKWDGSYGYHKTDEDGLNELTNDEAVQKSIFHIGGGKADETGMHTHVKGFTIISKNTRYGFHKESGGYGRNVEWVIENCIIEYGGRPDITNGAITPVIGMGMSPFEVGMIKETKAKYFDDFKGSRVINCHDNKETTLYAKQPSLKTGSKLYIEDCDFNSEEIRFASVYGKDEELPTTNSIVYVKNCRNIKNQIASRNWKIVDDNKIKIVETSSNTVSIESNKFYKFGEVSELNITLAEITDTTQLNEFMFEFVSGETATTLTLPDTIKWLETPSIESNKIYQCSIVDNIGILVGVVNV